MKTQHDKIHPAIYLLNKITLYRREGIPSLISKLVHQMANEVPSLTADCSKSKFLPNPNPYPAKMKHIASFRY